MTHEEFIAALGGPTRLSRVIARRSPRSIGRANVSHWRHRGIPYRYHALLCALADEQGIEPPADLMSCVRTEVAA